MSEGSYEETAPVVFSLHSALLYFTDTQTKVTNATGHSIHASATAGVSKY